MIRVALNGERKEILEARIQRALQAAQKYSLVANSVKSEIVMEAEVVVEDVKNSSTDARQNT